ncbi:MAG: hypothetical protein AB1480_01240 [Nitrospirota bacterium]
MKEAFAAIDNAGTASILSQFYHSEEKEKGCIAEPLDLNGVPNGI